MITTLEKLNYLAGATRFRHISEKLYMEGDKIYQEAGLQFKASWFPVYYVLALSDSPLTILQIAEQIDFSHISVKNVLRELEKSALVNIEINPADKRSRLVSLSVKGRKHIYRLKPVWISIASVLMKIFQSGHPDFMNILNRIDQQIDSNPINKMIAELEDDSIMVLDYNPGLNQDFRELTRPWLTQETNGQLRKEDGIIKNYPNAEHLLAGGFYFYASYKDQIVGFVSLRRLDDKSFEFTEPLINPDYYGFGIEKTLLERSICRCIENQADELYLQTRLRKTDADDIYLALGFKDSKPHPKMEIQEQNKRFMCLRI